MFERGVGWRTKKAITDRSLSDYYHFLQRRRRIRAAVSLRLFAFLRYQHTPTRHKKRFRDGHAQEVASLLRNLYLRIPRVIQRLQQMHQLQIQIQINQQNRLRDERRRRRNFALNQDEADEMIVNLFNEN